MTDFDDDELEVSDEEAEPADDDELAELDDADDF